jgi:hypothetical protein
MIFEEPSAKLTGRLLMVVIAVAASWIDMSREIRFELSRVILVTMCESSSAYPSSVMPSTSTTRNGSTSASSMMLWPREFEPASRVVRVLN